MQQAQQGLAASRQDLGVEIVLEELPGALLVLFLGPEDRLFLGLSLFLGHGAVEVRVELVGQPEEALEQGGLGHEVVSDVQHVELQVVAQFGGEVLGEEIVVQLGALLGEGGQAGDRRFEGGRVALRVHEGREEREARRFAGRRDVGHGFDLLRTEDPDAQLLVAGAEVEGLCGPGGDAGAGGDDEDAGRAAATGRDQVLEPGEALGGVDAALHLEDDHQEDAFAAAQLEHEVGAALGGSQAVEVGVAELVADAAGQLEAVDLCEQGSCERWLFAEQVDERVVGERGHAGRFARERASVAGPGVAAAGWLTRRRRRGTAGARGGRGISGRAGRRPARSRSTRWGAGPCTRGTCAGAGRRRRRG